MKLPSGDEIPHMDERVTCVVEQRMHVDHPIPYLAIGEVEGFFITHDLARIQIRLMGMGGGLTEHRLSDEGVTWIRGWHFPRSAEGKSLLVSNAMART